MFVPTPRNDAVLRRYGPYPAHLNLMNRKQTAVQRQLRRAGLAGYEPVTQATLLALVETAARPTEFFDIGAHIGFYSTLMSVIFPSELVRVRAFEPTPDTASIAGKIAKANRAAYKLEPLAISSDDGTAELFISDKAETSNSLTAGFRASHESVTVETMRLDTYCSRHGVSPSVLKIDVETHEAHVLDGAIETLRTARPAVVCEILPSTRGSGTMRSLERVSALGYVIHRWDAQGGWTPTHLDDVLSYANPDQRDWLFTPGLLSPDLKAATEAWSQAIAECPEGLNLFTEAGSPPPADWAAPHHVPGVSRPDPTAQGSAAPGDVGTMQRLKEVLADSPRGRALIASRSKWARRLLASSPARHAPAKLREYVETTYVRHPSSNDRRRSGGRIGRP